MIPRFMIRLFAWFSSFDPKLLEWACEQEKEAKASTAAMKHHSRQRHDLTPFMELPPERRTHHE
jgi:hypothetical protein